MTNFMQHPSRITLQEGCGTGCIARNDKGDVSFFTGKHVKDHSDVEVVEAEGIV